jgi:hypothetical protein
MCHSEVSRRLQITGNRPPIVTGEVANCVSGTAWAYAFKKILIAVKHRATASGQRFLKAMTKFVNAAYRILLV